MNLQTSEGEEIHQKEQISQTAQDPRFRLALQAKVGLPTFVRPSATAWGMVSEGQGPAGGLRSEGGGP